MIFGLYLLSSPFEKGRVREGFKEIKVIDFSLSDALS
jgi:hypothetical protein